MPSQRQSRAGRSKQVGQAEDLACRLRRALARDLHDGPSQALTAAAFQLHFLSDESAVRDSPEARQRVAYLIGVVERCAEQIRGVSWMLNPMAPDGPGRADALQAFVGEFGRRTGRPTELTVSGDPDSMAEVAFHTLRSAVQLMLAVLRRCETCERVSLRIEQRDSRWTLYAEVTGELQAADMQELSAWAGELDGDAGSATHVIRLPLE